MGTEQDGDEVGSAIRASLTAIERAIEYLDARDILGPATPDHGDVRAGLARALVTLAGVSERTTAQRREARLRFIANELRAALGAITDATLTHERPRWFSIATPRQTVLGRSEFIGGVGVYLGPPEAQPEPTSVFLQPLGMWTRVARVEEWDDDEKAVAAILSGIERHLASTRAGR